MPDHAGFDYGKLMQRALRSLMVEVLGRVAEDGLPGDHHLYISFDTTHPGVDMADWLHDAYPDEMTIVMQEWFEDLAVMGDRFQVTLSFRDTPHTLVVPFDAVRTFVDPSVEFGLKFDAHDSSEDEEYLPPVLVAAAEPEETAPETEEPDEGDATSADVVSLDTFRKH
ncbi:MAG: ClpXP protease specificity-enhancing factor SspB [Pseudomonadota bacterium]